ncbi:hypothetical protein LCGC14_1871720 [marine sediment metagenome]|uniref:Uncharacterized protein n=1 Tax=marine sediment metagenome TaxID=412755 RepID=A0A0F9G4Q3_9ZZZZ
MDKEVRKVLEGITKEVDSLTASSGKFESRLLEIEGSVATMKESQPTLHSKDTSESASLEEQVEKVARLEERNVFLEGKDYQNQVIQGFLRELDADNFLTIGVKLGYLEDTEARPEDLEKVEGAGPVEVALGDNRTLKVSKEKPEDMTGWEYSETQGLYIKLE